ncbi:MAG: Gfo/Idh/MocA family oxidoreductase [Bacteroidota bacterium]
MKKIRFAIIGCGKIGERHAVQAQLYGELIAVCDIMEKPARDLAEKYQLPFYVSIEDLLENETTADVMVICTPNGLHATQSIQALQKGYHVLVEKPMAVSSKDCKRMMEAAAASGKHLFTVMQNRFNPPVMAVKKALDENIFGKLYSFQITCLWNRGADYYRDSWHGTKELDGGILFTQFSHFIDLLYVFFGEVKTISAFTKNAAHENCIEFEDSGVAILACENGVIGTIHFSINSFQKNAEGSLTILGEKGTVKIGGEYLNTLQYQQFESGQLMGTIPASEPNEYDTYRGSMRNHDKVYETVVATLQTGKPFYATPMEGFKTVEIIERIYRAALSVKSD